MGDMNGRIPAPTNEGTKTYPMSPNTVYVSSPNDETTQSPALVTVGGSVVQRYTATFDKDDKVGLEKYLKEHADANVVGTTNSEGQDANGGWGSTWRGNTWGGTTQPPSQKAAPAPKAAPSIRPNRGLTT
jgi:hypothetical protein